MTSGFWSALAACAMVAGCARDGETVGVADQASLGQYRVVNPRSGSITATDPGYLINSVEGWGPQTILLAVDRHISPQISILNAPGVEISKEKVTRTVQQAAGWSLSEEFEVTASSNTEVPVGWYERMEAYPTFQTVTWDLLQDGPWGATQLAHVTAYRPMGVFFRVVVVVEGSEGSAQPAPGGHPVPAGEPIHD